MRTMYKTEIKVYDKKDLYKIIAYNALKLDKALNELDNDNITEAIRILKGDK